LNQIKDEVRLGFIDNKFERFLSKLFFQLTSIMTGNTIDSRT